MSKQDVKSAVRSKEEIGDLPKVEKQKKLEEKPAQNSNNLKINHVQNKNITLTEDVFGNYVLSDGKSEKIYRFTWRNHNNIEVEVITYGARIRSMKLPNKKGVAEDIVLGYKDLAGYIYYESFPLGATIGRVSNYIENSTFVIDGKQYWLSSNSGKHHYNGGLNGFDRVCFTPYVEGTKVILSHTSPDLNEGYPGSLLVRITFELTPKNEFSINIEALTTKPTLVNLSNLMYFNLAGHQAGPEEIYKHTVTINSNCYTIYDKDKFPTGDIQNVVHTDFDFQIPTILKSCMGIKPEDGYDQNLCVNRGTEQGLCFVARALHVPSGRILEIYSDQYGVNFNTANNFGPGLPKMAVVPKAAPVEKELATESDDNIDNIFELLDEIHEILLKSPDIPDGEDYDKIKELVERISKCKFNAESVVSSAVFQLDATTGGTAYDSSEYNLYHMMNALQLNYLIVIKEIAQKALGSPSGITLRKAVNKIVELVQKMDTEVKEGDLQKSKSASREEILKTNQTVLEKYSNMYKDQKDLPGNQDQGDRNKQTINSVDEDTRSLEKRTDSIQLKKKVPNKNSNAIPSLYKDGRIHGKNNAIYKRHGALSFQTQNYPNAIYHPNFPNSILRPGETYRHTIVYKLFVQSGNATKWIKRQQPC